MNATMPQLLATALFALAILHTFSVNQFRKISSRFTEGSIGENFFHLLAEVEVVFALWAGVFVLSLMAMVGQEAVVHYMDSLDFTEPVFVFAIMAVAATRPVIAAASGFIARVARALPLPGETGFVLSAFILGPLMGSFITEPAAMTVTALVLRERLFEKPFSPMLKYLALGTLFVNVSIGGVLTPYAAPPVLMVAKTWGWDFGFMLAHFGYKAAIAVVLNAVVLVGVGWKDFSAAGHKPKEDRAYLDSPVWLVLTHLFVLFLVVFFSHHVPLFLGVFLFFLGVVTVTGEYQEEVRLRESLLVATFLGGLVVLGGMQSWWLKPLLAQLTEGTLFVGAASLTAVTDNAALTFLGSQVEGLSESLRYALVAGAVAGGGLTVIANAPNPAGYSILQNTFGKTGVSPLKLFLGALVPTLVDMAAFWILPHLSI
jgi:hypothetical protein